MVGLQESSRSGRPKTIDSDCVLQAIKANLVSSNQRVSDKHGISSVTCYL